MRMVFYYLPVLLLSEKKIIGGLNPTRPTIILQPRIIGVPTLARFLQQSQDPFQLLGPGLMVL